MTNDDLTFEEVAQHLGRSVRTVRLYVRYEGLVSRVENGRAVVRRSDLEEFRSREEIAAMLRAGDHLKRKRCSRAVAV